MILRRMILRLLTGSILAALVGLLALVLLIDFLETARHLLGDKADLASALAFYGCKAVAFVHFLLPVALVIGTAVAFARLGRHLELRALAAAGVGPFQIIRPVILVSLGVVGLVVVLGEFAVPAATDHLERLMSERYGRIDSSWRFFRSHMWMRGDGNRLIRTSRRSADGRELRGAILLEVDERFHLIRRTDVGLARFDGQSWQGRRVVERSFAEGRQVGYRESEASGLDWPERPDSFRDLSGRPQQMSMSQLRATIGALEQRGLEADEYRLAWHGRFSFPLLGGALLLFALPWMIGPARRRSLAGAIIESSALIFVAYFLLSMTKAAVSAGTLAPWLGSWLPLLILATACLPRWVLISLRHRAGGGS